MVMSIRRTSRDETMIMGSGGILSDALVLEKGLQPLLA